MKVLFIVLCCMVAVVLLTPGVVCAKSTHEKRIMKYEGTATCVRCHKDAAKDVVQSLHYQQMAEPQFIEGWEKGKAAGMMVTY